MQKTAAVLLAVYLVVLLDLTLMRFHQPGAGVNWVPMATVGNSWKAGPWSMLVNVAGNLAAFAPLGLLLPCLRRGPTTALQVVVAATLLSLTIESLQYRSGLRVADVDDVMLNTLGGLIGYLGYNGLRRIGLVRGTVAPRIGNRGPRPARALRQRRAAG